MSHSCQTDICKTVRRFSLLLFNRIVKSERNRRLILKTPLVCLEFLDEEGQEENNLNAVCSPIQFETKIKSVSLLPDQRSDDLQDGGIFDAVPRFWLLVILIKNLGSHSLRQNLEEDVVSRYAKLILVKQEPLVQQREQIRQIHRLSFPFQRRPHQEKSQKFKRLGREAKGRYTYM